MSGGTGVPSAQVRNVPVDATKTVLNEDVLMPKAWYINKELALPEEYQ